MLISEALLTATTENNCFLKHISDTIEVREVFGTENPGVFRVVTGFGEFYFHESHIMTFRYTKGGGSHRGRVVIEVSWVCRDADDARPDEW